MLKKLTHERDILQDQKKLVPGLYKRIGDFQKHIRDLEHENVQLRSRVEAMEDRERKRFP
jgi:predicted  nucleic acid-binding Zn-ribbon protein